ncbi:MAG TPA: hypothetical protein VD735_07110 [Candidatus Saccharimonadales bacterium]|nr:hypothetical protein [Candidatus Saccharimonadales bacterium]
MGYTNTTDAAFSFTFITYAVRALRFLCCGLGYLLLGMVIYSWVTGSEVILAGVIDGTFLRSMLYSLAAIVAMSVGYGLFNASAQALYAKAASIKLHELAGATTRRTKTSS